MYAILDVPEHPYIEPGLGTISANMLWATVVLVGLLPQ